MAESDTKTDSDGSADIRQRKSEHLDVVLSGRARPRRTESGLSAIRFEHVAMPELALSDIDLSTGFLGRRLQAPLLISSMTGGPQRAAGINAALAAAAQACGVALAVGSQRIALEARAAGGLDRSLRGHAPDAAILANFGAAQLLTWDGPDMARRAVDMIEADGLIIHLNPLQEAVQAGGDTNWRGVIAAIGRLQRSVPFPIVVKEVGNGISGAMAAALRGEGIGVIDVAGAGGTSWAAVEAERSRDPRQAAIAEAFRDWGIPTATAIQQVRAACPDGVIIASGGIADGIDAAKAIHLGADLVGQAAGLLDAALAGPAAAIERIAITIEQLRIACFCTGSRTPADLRAARRLPPD